MKQDKHTPGPWSIRKSACGNYNITTSQKPRTFNICKVNEERAEHRANAYLIAAAPELLEVLENIMVIVPNEALAVPLYEEAVKAIAKAIAKAKGETND